MSEETGKIKGLIVGLILGVVLGVLFAPAEGKETRKKVKDFLDELPDKTKEQGEKVVKVLKKMKDGVEKKS
jgi:gas vesicle protein